MEERRHDVVRVSGENSNAVTRGRIPDSNRLVIGARELMQKRPFSLRLKRQHKLWYVQSRASHDGIEQCEYSRDDHEA